MCEIRKHLKRKLFYICNKISCIARCWWLMPVILTSWEAEIRRIEIQDQSRQIGHETPSPK
jgi:hypothetical protein